MSQPIFTRLQQSGLTHLGYRFLDSAGANIGARITTGITESAALDGSYAAASPTTPANAWGVYWNDSVVTSMKATQWFDTVGNLGTGTGGAFAITIHATDGVNDIQNAIVAVRNGAVLIGLATTDVNGDTSGISADAGTYDVTAEANGYRNYSGTITVTAIGTFTITLTANAIPIPPVDPTLQTVYGTLFGLNGPAANAEIQFVLVPVMPNRPLTVNGNVVTFQTATATTDVNGFFTIDLPRTDLLDNEARYNITAELAQLAEEGVALGAAPLDISTL